MEDGGPASAQKYVAIPRIKNAREIGSYGVWSGWGKPHRCWRRATFLEVGPGCRLILDKLKDAWEPDMDRKAFLITNIVNKCSVTERMFRIKIWYISLVIRLFRFATMVYCVATQRLSTSIKESIGWCFCKRTKTQNMSTWVVRLQAFIYVASPETYLPMDTTLRYYYLYNIIIF